MQGSKAVATTADPVAESIDAATLYRAHAAFVAGFLRHMGAAEADLDDLMQDVFVTAHAKGGYRPGPAAPRTWLASLAIQMVVARRRARARQPQSSLAVDWLADVRGPEAALEAQRSLERVQLALGQLSLEHRAAFVLFELEGETCESIAAIWDVPIGTVYSRLHNARRRFLEAYERGGARRRKRDRREEP